jgi:hypothetical protein
VKASVTRYSALKARYTAVRPRIDAALARSRAGCSGRLGAGSSSPPRSPANMNAHVTVIIASIDHAMESSSVAPTTAT